MSEAGESTLTDVAVSCCPHAAWKPLASLGGRDQNLVALDPGHLSGDGIPKATTRGAKAKAPSKVIAKRVLGSVVWFKEKKGYGFISRHDTQEDVFVPHMAITGRNPCKFRGSMDDGEMLEFYAVQGQRGTEAVNVTGPAGAPLKGSCYTAHLTRICQDFSIHCRELPLRRPKSTEGDADESEGSGEGFTVAQRLRRPLPGRSQDQRLRRFPPSREACDPPPIDPGYHSSTSSNQTPGPPPPQGRRGILGAVRATAESPSRPRG
ncbi:Y-box-binding protein 1-like [Oryx dammah]|uniref:Y-box-binding protein 1-like n=1 Tax=Oryx dammah TaxID=59534 RepID=UPI001A9A7E2D|nr:Y-box-binding protein 1-like [Oryx dammah]